MTNTISNPGFSSKDPSEVVMLGFDFLLLTASPSSPVVTITRHAGAADEAPAGVLSGAATVNGSRVLQAVTGGVTGCDYLLRCQVDAPDGSRYVLAGVLPVRAA